MKDIIIFGGIDWDGGRKLPIHHVAARLARNNRVFYVDNFGAVRDFWISDIPRALKKTKNIFGKKRKHSMENDVVVWKQMVVPVPRLPSLIGRLNVFLLRKGMERLVRTYRIKDPVIWTRVPTDLVWRSLEKISRRMLVYQAVDKFPFSPKISVSLRPRLIESEKMFCRSADIVFASARGLYDEKKRENPNTYFFPNGVDADIFLKDYSPDPRGDIKRPVIGFAGALGTWVDYRLLMGAARLRPEYSFVLLGPRAPESDLCGLDRMPNVYLPGVIKYEGLPAWFRKFDVGLIPYRVTDFTNYTFPSKMAEYLTVGLPVISTPLPEVLPYSKVVYIVKDPEEMVLSIDRALQEKDRETRYAERMAVAATLSWDRIVTEMERLIDECLGAEENKDDT